MSAHILAAMTAAFQDDRSMHTETYRKLHAAAREAITDPKHPAPTMLLQSDAGPVPVSVIASSPMAEPPPPQVSFEDTGEAYEAGFQAGRKSAEGELERNSELAIHALAQGREWKAHADKAEERYQRECLGLNNEGDPIGGDPPAGWKRRAEKAEATLAAYREIEARYHVPAAPVPLYAVLASSTVNGKERGHINISQASTEHAAIELAMSKFRKDWPSRQFSEPSAFPIEQRTAVWKTRADAAEDQLAALRIILQEHQAHGEART